MGRITIEGTDEQLAAIRVPRGVSVSKGNIEQAVNETGEKEVNPMAESRYCKDCRPYAEVDDLKHQGALKEKSDELERLKVEANRAQETLEQQIEQFKGIVQDYADPDHRQKCTSSNCAVGKVHKQIEDGGFKKGKESIGKSEVEQWLSENRYIPPIKEIVVQRGKK